VKVSLRKKIAFVSCNKTHAHSSFTGNSDALTGKLFLSDARQVEILEHELADFQPDLVIVFDPENFTQFARVLSRYFSVGYFLDPLPFDGNYGDTKLNQNFDKLEKLSLEISTTYKYLIAGNSNFSRAYESLFNIWQYRTLPVNDSLFRARLEPDLSNYNQVLFAGEVNENTKKYIEEVNTKQSVISSLEIGNDQIVGSDFPVGLNLHSFKFVDFEHDALIHMANGRLLLSQVLSPKLNFKNGFSHLEFDSPGNLMELLEDISSYPDSYEAIRRYGFHATSRYKASKMWSDFMLDVELSR
jgi:hypothetical protein